MSYYYVRKKALNWFSSQEKGFSLVEVVIALAILSIVLAMGYTYFFFGSNTFQIGGTQSNLQRDIRLVSDFITREVRYATCVSVRSSQNESCETCSSGEAHSYFYLNNGMIYHNDVAKTDAVIESITFTYVEKNDAGMIEFVIDGRSTNGRQTYSLESEVYLVNLRNPPTVKNAPDIVLCYKKPIVD